MTRTLILGGTAWLGHEIAAQAIARGDEVTCLARGTSGPAPVGAHLVRVDREAPGAYRAVQDSTWDEVVELSFGADTVSGALDSLADRAGHWTLVSSVSVYASNAVPGADETAVLAEPSDPGDYAHANVVAERLSMSALGDRLLIARPGLIAGPGDPSDRLGYWVGRFAAGADGAPGEAVLVPETAGRHVQFIDHRDLATWLLDAGRAGMTGIVNAVGESRPLAEVLFAAAEVAGFSGERIAATDDWLLGQGVDFWAGPRSLPLWLPLGEAGFARRDRARFATSGGQDRGLTSTLADILADERRRGLGRPRRAGLTRADELGLVAALGGRAG